MTLSAASDTLDQAVHLLARSPVAAHVAQGRILAARFGAVGRDTHALLRAAIHDVDGTGGHAPDLDAWRRFAYVADLLAGAEHADTPGLRAALVAGLRHEDAEVRRSCVQTLHWHCWERKDAVRALGAWEALVAQLERDDADEAWLALQTLECLAVEPLADGGVALDTASYALFVQWATQREGVWRYGALRALSRLSDDRGGRARLRADGIVEAAQRALADAQPEGLEEHERRDLRRFLRRMGVRTRA